MLLEMSSVIDRLKEIIEDLEAAKKPMVRLWWKALDGVWHDAIYVSDPTESPTWRLDGEWFLEWL